MITTKFGAYQKNFPSSHKPLKGVSRHKKWWLFFAGLLILFFLFNYFFPQVTVNLVLTAENMTQELDLKLTTDQTKSDPANNIFVAELKTAEESIKEKFNATGQKDLGQKASGQAIFYNTTGPSQPVTPDVDLMTITGVIVRVKETITIPGAKVDAEGRVVPGQIQVVVEAKEAGDKANGTTGRFNINSLPWEKQDKIYGQLSGPLQGGTSNIVTVVSQEDLDQAKDKLTKNLQIKLKDKLRQEAGDNLSVVEQLISYEVTSISPEVAADSKMKEFDLSLTLKASALIFSQKEMRQVLRDKFSNNLKADQSLGEAENISLEIINAQADFNLGLADLKIKATFPVVKKVDLDEIKKNILGKNESEARRYLLSLPYIKDARFVFSLGMGKRIPNWANRVQVVIKNN
ncbi:MAG TPA: hypothetical protein PKZ16_00935 [bacterium]|nr:hypothetical protein [bacterium]HPL95448.1 hypothetical protein [bacterium]